MKRDMDIIRSILLSVEDGKYQYGEFIRLEDVSEEVCAYHVALMRDAGLVDAEIIKTCSSPHAAAQIHRLTSGGHDFCDGIRQETIWNRAKERILKPGASYGLSVLVEYVKVQVHQQIFGP